MKKLIGADIGSYSFNPATKQITLSGMPSSLSLEQLLVITNVTDGIILYNFADPALGGSISGNAITLEYDTVSMSSGDSLQIFVDIPDTSEAQLVALVESVFFRLEQLVAAQQYPSWLNMTNNSLQATLLTGSTTAVTGSLTTAGTVSTVTNLSQIGGVNADIMIPAQSDQAWGVTIRSLLI